MNSVSFEWLAPFYLWTLPVLCIPVALYVYDLLKKRALIRMIAPQKVRSLVLSNFSPLKKIMKTLCGIGGLACLWLALARPAVPEKVTTVGQEGRDLLIAIDISRSMLAQDRAPNRLTFAKQKIRELIEQLQVERVGLIVFSGSTFVQCPLTHDYGAFLMYLDQLDVETISSGTTAIDQAIICALDAFEVVGDRKHKLLALFTDGEDFSSNLSAVKRQAQEQNMHIFTIGVGTTQGAPIPLYDIRGNNIGHQKDGRGSIVISRLNEGILKNLANDSGGQYLLATEDAHDVMQIARSVATFEKERLYDASCQQVVEYYHYPLVASFIFYALEFVL